MLRAFSSVIVVLAASVVAVPQTTGRQSQHPIIDPDSFYFTTLEREKPILNDFARALQHAPERKGYILAYGGRVSCKGEAGQILELIKSYLVESRKVDASRIVIIGGGYREETTYQMWRVLPGAAGPRPAPTVDPRAVKFRGGNHPRCKSLRGSIAKQCRA